MKRVLLACAAMVVMVGCFDFDHAWAVYCDGGHCGDGGATGGGSGGGVGTGGATGGGAGTGGAAVGGGSGGGTGGGTGACLGYGAVCAHEGDCCASSDAGLPMACSRNFYCEDMAPDCRADGFSCSADAQCCGRQCEGGVCKIAGSYNAPCARATDCRLELVCLPNGTCDSAVDAGERCVASEFCATSFCAALDAGSLDGVCQPATGCGALGASPAPDCCPGLQDVGGTCKQSDGAWCYYDSSCASGNCQGGRCGPAPASNHHARCFGSGTCPGADYCDPVNGLCVERWCLPAGLNAWSGCCRSDGYQCKFADAGVCTMPGVASSNGPKCCVGTASNGHCDPVMFW